MLRVDAIVSYSCTRQCCDILGLQEHEALRLKLLMQLGDKQIQFEYL